MASGGKGRLKRSPSMSSDYDPNFCDIDQATYLLTALDPVGRHTLQTFNERGKKVQSTPVPFIPELTQIIHAPASSLWLPLAHAGQLNQYGAGVFYSAGRMDGKGRG